MAEPDFSKSISENIEEGRVTNIDLTSDDSDSSDDSSDSNENVKVAKQPENPVERGTGKNPSGIPGAENFEGSNQPVAKKKKVQEDGSVKTVDTINTRAELAQETGGDQEDNQSSTPNQVRAVKSAEAPGKRTNTRPEKQAELAENALRSTGKGSQQRREVKEDLENRGFQIKNSGEDQAGTGQARKQIDQVEQQLNVNGETGPATEKGKEFVQEQQELREMPSTALPQIKKASQQAAEGQLKEATETLLQDRANVGKELIEEGIAGQFREAGQTILDPIAPSEKEIGDEDPTEAIFGEGEGLASGEGEPRKQFQEQLPELSVAQQRLSEGIESTVQEKTTRQQRQTATEAVRLAAFGTTELAAEAAEKTGILEKEQTEQVEKTQREIIGQTPEFVAQEVPEKATELAALSGAASETVTNPKRVGEDIVKGSQEITAEVNEDPVEFGVGEIGVDVGLDVLTPGLAGAAVAFPQVEKAKAGTAIPETSPQPKPQPQPEVRPQPDKLETLDIIKPEESRTDTEISTKLKTGSGVASAGTIESVLGPDINTPEAEAIEKPQADIQTEVSPITDPVTETVADPLSQPLSSPISTAITEPLPEPVAEPVAQPQPQPIPAAVSIFDFEQESVNQKDPDLKRSEELETQFTPTLGGSLFGESREVSQSELEQLNQQSFSGLGVRENIKVTSDNRAEKELENQLGL